MSRPEVAATLRYGSQPIAEETKGLTISA